MEAVDRVHLKTSKSKWVVQHTVQTIMRKLASWKNSQGILKFNRISWWLINHQITIIVKVNHKSNSKTNMLPDTLWTLQRIRRTTLMCWVHMDKLSKEVANLLLARVQLINQIVTLSCLNSSDSRSQVIKRELRIHSKYYRPDKILIIMANISN